MAVIVIAVALAAGVMSWSCARGDNPSPQYLQSKYGLPDASFQRVATPDGSIPATIVPVTLADGRRAQLIIPQRGGEYPVYLRDESGVSPVVVDRTVDRDRFVRSRPVLVERAPSRVVHRRRRDWKKEVLIVAGSSGAGTAIGALAGGGKGAAIGALSGGAAGLVYDLATRHR